MIRPRVGISRCLAGDQVRYDGTHKRDSGLLAVFGPLVEWVPVCPEVEVGMGTPREPIELVPSDSGVPSGSRIVRLIGVGSRRDWTVAMHAWARQRADALRTLKLAGFVLKARSPSCGPVVGDMRGLFAQALLDAMPDLPIADEDELQDPQSRDAFLAHLLDRSG